MFENAESQLRVNAPAKAIPEQTKLQTRNILSMVYWFLW
jgi:hypothetical protein